MRLTFDGNQDMLISRSERQILLGSSCHGAPIRDHGRYNEEPQGEAAPVEVVLMEAVLAAVQLVPAEAVDPVEAARVQITTNQIQMARQAR